jgi:hypothetical protein
MLQYLEQFKDVEVKAYAVNRITVGGGFLNPKRSEVFSIHFFDSVDETDKGFHEVGYVIPSMGDTVKRIDRFNAQDTDLIELNT